MNDRKIENASSLANTAPKQPVRPTAEQFEQRLNRAANIVAAWPDQLQRALGSAGYFVNGTATAIKTKESQ